MGIGWGEMLVIALVFLIFVGPKELPGMMRKLGRVASELKNASRELRNQVTLEGEEIPSPVAALREAARELQGSLPRPDQVIEALGSQVEEGARDLALTAKTEFAEIGAPVPEQESKSGDVK